MRLKTAVLLVVVLTLTVYLVNRESVAQPAAWEPAPSAKLDNEVTWGTLRGLDRQTGRASDDVKALDGKKIRIAGYVVPLDDEATKMSEFLLAPYAGACIHTPPPPPNQLIYVKMARGEEAYASLMDAVWVEGTLFIGRRGSPYGPTFYAMTASGVKPYR